MRECTPLTNSSSLDHEIPESPPETFNTHRFSFLQRILSNVKPRKMPQKLSLQPIRHIVIDNKNEEQLSAKTILKKAIILDVQPKFTQEKSDNFLMKGKTLTGSKKPIDCQMATLLQGINERIKKELQKQQKAMELPQLAEKEKSEIVVEPKNFDCGIIFKNMKEMRIKRNIEQSTKRKIIRNEHLQKRENSIKNQSAINKSQTENNNRESNKGTKHNITTISHSLCPPLNKKQSEVSFKKGYIAYDEEARQFLEECRASLAKDYHRVTEKTKEITAKFFFVLDCCSLVPIAGKNINQSIEIASLSKIMTCYLCLLICRKYKIDIYSHQIRVSEKASQTPGTSAQLQSGDVVSVFDLLLGLMLPSGNDASVAIAEGMGKIIQKHKKKQTKRTFFETFVVHMNILSKELNLNQSWNNSSGLSLNPNFSTPESIALLTAIAVRDQVFNRIVNTKLHQVQISNQKYGLSRKITWRNTNKLLDSGWQGVKTGTTQNAGHCLMAKKGRTLVCVFNCETLSRRFSQSVRLYETYSDYKSADYL